MHYKSYIMYCISFIIFASITLILIEKSSVTKAKVTSIQYESKETVNSTLSFDSNTVISSTKDVESVDNYSEDEFGNYIISEEQLSINDNLPFNEDGYIVYNIYTDDNGVILNPMPDYYAEYEEYFVVGVGEIKEKQ